MARQIKGYNPTRVVMGMWLRIAVKALEDIQDMHHPQSEAGKIAAEALKSVPSVNQIDGFTLGNY
ncbi:MAG: hypothetical protein KDE62_08630 [Calditrichaeota bacterium]|nr:hypothetical protein [Calditrichota bacterium]